jgi:antirestriction protein ArdC
MGISAPVLANQAAYIHGWLTKLRSDHRLVVIAASHAQRAADYLLNLGLNGRAVPLKSQ